MDKEWDVVQPSLTHMALLGLYMVGKLKFIVTQNVDSLHLRSGPYHYFLSILHSVFLFSTEWVTVRRHRAFLFDFHFLKLHYFMDYRLWDWCRIFLNRDTTRSCRWASRKCLQRNVSILQSRILPTIWRERNGLQRDGASMFLWRSLSFWILLDLFCFSSGIPLLGVLQDELLDWEDELPEPDLEISRAHCRRADLAICLGTSLRVQVHSIVC